MSPMRRFAVALLPLSLFLSFLALLPFVSVIAIVTLSESEARASYEDGLEASREGNSIEALEYWMEASADPRSMAAIATLYERGDGVSQDMELAAEWYRRAAERGNYRAMAQLANLSLRGLSGEDRTSMEWRSALETIRGKDPYADYVLAFFYANGHGGERRLKDALDLLENLTKMQYAPFVALYNQVRQRLTDQEEGIVEAEYLAWEMRKGEASFDEQWRDKRITVAGWVNSVKGIRQHGYLLNFGGPNASVVPADNLSAVFYAKARRDGDRISQLRQGDYVKIDGVYVGPHPFDLGPSALTLFGCRLLQVTSSDLGR